MYASACTLRNSIIYKQKTCNFAISTQSLHELLSLLIFHRLFLCQICKWNSYIRNENSKENEQKRSGISMTTWKEFAEEKEHYLQFNLTYDYCVPIMLKLWIIWSYRRRRLFSHMLHSQQHNTWNKPGELTVHAKNIKNYFNIKTCSKLLFQYEPPKENE